MKPTSTYIRRLYLLLTLLQTLAASFIWGVNTIFLLQAGLSNTEAFLANAFFTVGQVLFEVPTGIVADIKGRRVSYLLGGVTLALATLLYLAAWYAHAPLIVWAGSSILIGLGFTFFSGATEAWLVDAMEYAGNKQSLDQVFAQAQVVGGAAMLVGSVAGGVVAQLTSIAVPYLIRASLLGVNFAVAWFWMKDWGFEPTKSANWWHDVKKLGVSSLEFGWKKPAVRWMMLAAPVVSGVGLYAFYAMQPFLLKLYGNETAYAVAGLAAAIVAAAQIIGGLLVPYVAKVVRLRTTVVLFATLIGGITLFGLGLTNNFWLALGLLCIWGLVSALVQPVRQAYLNGLIPSKQRATVLSFDSLFSSSGGAVVQPILGRVADSSSYASSFVVGALLQILALPFVVLARRERVEADKIK